MPSKRPVLALACCLVLLAAAAPQQQDRPPLYDPTADSFQDLQDTIAAAQESGKRILLNVGGNWCGWCYTMDGYLKANDDVRERLEAGFIFLKINMSQENRNEEFLSQYPKIHGYPHIFVLDSDGTLLHSQDTYYLEEESSYHRGRWMHFLRVWEPR